MLGKKAFPLAIVIINVYSLVYMIMKPELLPFKDLEETGPLFTAAVGKLIIYALTIALTIYCVNLLLKPVKPPSDN